MSQKNITVWWTNDIQIMVKGKKQLWKKVMIGTNRRDKAKMMVKQYVRIKHG